MTTFRFLLYSENLPREGHTTKLPALEQKAESVEEAWELVQWSLKPGERLMGWHVVETENDHY